MGICIRKDLPIGAVLVCVIAVDGSDISDEFCVALVVHAGC